MAALPSFASDDDSDSSAVRTTTSVITGMATTLTRFVVRLVAASSGFAATLLGLVSRTLSNLGERSAELADVDTPVQEVRRSGRRRAGLWFAGGFLAGAGVGFAASELRHHSDQPAMVDDATARHLAAVQSDVAES